MRVIEQTLMHNQLFNKHMMSKERKLEGIKRQNYYNKTA